MRGILIVAGWILLGFGVCLFLMWLFTLNLAS